MLLDIYYNNIKINLFYNRKANEEYSYYKY